MSEYSTRTMKNMPKLSISEQIDIVKNKKWFSFAFPVTILILMICGFGAATGGTFFESNVLMGFFNQALIIGTMATAVSFIYTTGNLDISVGSVMGLAAMLGAMVYQSTESILLMVLTTCVSGILLMIFNCTLSVTFNIKTVIVAIVVMQLYNGIVTEMLGPNGIKINYVTCKELEKNGFRIIAFIIYFVFCLIMYHFTTLGRRLRFVGGNEECARQTGINPKKSIFMSFFMAGIGVGLAAVFTIIRTGTVSNEVGSGMGMDVMLATVLGGMSIFGGAKANVYAGIIGALTVAALNKGLLMVGVSSSLIQGVRGVLFIVLVFLNSVRLSTLPTKQQV